MALQEAVAARIVTLGRRAIHARGRFDLALAGGNTPRDVYTRLATPPYSERLDWGRIHVFFGDERYVPLDHPDSNYRMAREALLDQVPLPKANVHPIPTDGGDPAADAARYGQCLHQQLPGDGTQTPVLDLILLGIGEDGHTASLFPKTPILSERTEPAAAVYVPHLNSWRISVTLPVIERARQRLFLAVGNAKARIVGQVLNRSSAAARLPVERVASIGPTEWHLDAAAASQLNGETQT